MKLLLSPKDGISATAACGKEPIFREGTFAPQEGNDATNMRNWQRRRVDICESGFAYDVSVMVKSTPRLTDRDRTAFNLYII